MAEEYGFRNLLSWQKAQALALEIIQVTAAMPRGAAQDVLVRQVIRSASSIGANIAEGHGRFTPRAHANHLSIAKGSACETDSWLDLLHRSGLMDAETERRLHGACMELIAMLTAKIRELEKLSAPGTVRDDLAEYDASDPSDGSRFEVRGSRGALESSD